MNQMAFDFGALKWTYFERGKKAGIYEATMNEWKCSINARDTSDVWVAISDMRRLITPIFRRCASVETAKDFCEKWLLQGFADKQDRMAISAEVAK